MHGNQQEKSDNIKNSRLSENTFALTRHAGIKQSYCFTSHGRDKHEMVHPGSHCAHHYFMVGEKTQKKHYGRNEIH